MPSTARRSTTGSWVWTVARAVQAVPPLFVIAVGTAVALGELAAVAGVRPLADPSASRAFLLLVLVITGVLGWALRVGAGAAPPRWLPLAPVVPALAMVGYALVVRLLPLGERAEWFMGGDHLRHLVFVAEEQSAGNLSYADQSYPRAWHTLVAAMWTATGARPDADGLRSLVDLMSTATWGLPAVLSIATGVLAAQLARRVGLSEKAIALAGLAGAAMVLWPPFLSSYQALGFENSFVGAIVLAVAAGELLSRRGLRATAVVLAGIVVCAHAWQLLLPALAAVLLALVWTDVVGGGWRARAGVGCCTVIAAVIASPALVAVVTDVGIAHAKDAGVDAPLPVAVLLVGAACSVGLVIAHRRDASLRMWGVVALLPGLTGLAVAVTVGVGVTEYYPSKLLWHSAVLGLASTAVVVVAGWNRLGRARTSAPVRLARAVAGAVGALAVALSLVTPAGAFVGAWSTVQGPPVLAAVTADDAGEAQVVWVGTTPMNNTVGRILLDFYRAGQTPVRAPQAPLDLAGDCELLKAAARPTVLTTASVEQVRGRYDCIGGVRVVRVTLPRDS